jgi:hypothetical protein
MNIQFSQEEVKDKIPFCDVAPGQVFLEYEDASFEVKINDKNSITLIEEDPEPLLPRIWLEEEMEREVTLVGEIEKIIIKQY